LTSAPGAPPESVSPDLARSLTVTADRARSADPVGRPLRRGNTAGPVALGRRRAAV